MRANSTLHFACITLFTQQALITIAMTTRHRIWAISRWFLLLFVLMFVFRLLYGYWATNADQSSQLDQADFFSTLDNVRRNYASEKSFKKEVSGNVDIQQQANAASSQKYEKTATIRAKTAQFDRDEQQLRQTIKHYNAIVQYERNSGNSGEQQLHLLIGIDPELFDTFYVAMRKIGWVRSKEIIKTDKTNEYRNLNAQKSSLEKTLASLNELKSKGGAVGDFIGLHDKILEIETKLQALGVDLGNFDQENEFCTVRYSLYEGSDGREISLLHRVKVALEWTITYYTALMFGLALMTSVSFMLLFIIDKLKLLAASNDSAKDKTK